MHRTREFRAETAEFDRRLLGFFEDWRNFVEQHRDEMVLKAELKDENADKAKLADDINKKFQDVCRIKLDKIEFVDSGTIPEDRQGIVDERKWE